MNPQIINIETWLPVFPGFYDTIFEPDTTDEEDYQNKERADYLPKIKWDDLDFDSEQYENDVMKQCCSYIEGELKSKGFVTSIKLQSINRPREYNFYNDSGNVEIGLTKKNIKAIKQYIIDNETAYREYLSREYTSCSGFMSHCSNEVSDWYEYTDNFTNFSKKGHYLGSILEFICRNENIDQEFMYYSLEIHIGKYCKNRENSLKCQKCGSWYKIKESPEHLEYDRTRAKQSAIWKELYGREPVEIKTFEQVYTEFSYLCNSCKP
jgi:hypothetical protein